MLPPAVERYLDRREAGPWELAGDRGKGFAGAIVIPALAEGATLPATLVSLAANHPALLARFLVVVVVNHRPDARPADQEENRRTLEGLPQLAGALPAMRLAWVDAASPGRELSLKSGGVGLARRIGCDLALSRLDYGCASPLLVSLDADTLVEPSYLSAIAGHFEAEAAGGAVIPFCHQRAGSQPEQEAIDRYELFLRCYVFGLALAGSPYAFHTVGSALACRADAYLRMGGMNSRRAGEDFYFLQQLQRTSGVTQLRGTVVHPACRPSHRVPFGTGRSVSRLLAGDPAAVLFYQPECFTILGAWLALVASRPSADGTALQAASREISPLLAEYLGNVGFQGVWERLRRNHPGPQALLGAFHGWFDGLKSMKLVHFLSEKGWRRGEPASMVAELLARGGITAGATVGEQLAALRKVQLGGDHREP